MLRPIAALELPIDDGEGASAIARRARGGREATCASDRGTIAHFDVRSARVAFAVRASTSRETNAVCWRDEHTVLYAADDVVVEADARKVSTNGDEESWVSRRFRGAADVVNGVDVDDANGLLAACDDHGEVRVYELASGALARVMRGHEGCVTSVAFRSKRGTSECVSSSTDCRAMKWDVKTKPVPAREWDARIVKSVEEYDRERARQVSGETETVMDDGGRRSFNPPMLHSVAVYRGAQSDANAPGARRVAASACGDGSVLVFDVDQRPLGTKGGASSSSSKKKNASRIAAGVFREGKAECVRLGADGISGHTNAATCADFIPWIDRADIVLSGGTDRRLIAWNWVAAAEDAAAAAAVASRRRDRKVNDLAFAVDARVACVVDTGNKLSLYALA